MTLPRASLHHLNESAKLVHYLALLESLINTVDPTSFDLPRLDASRSRLLLNQSMLLLNLGKQLGRQSTLLRLSKIGVVLIQPWPQLGISLPSLPGPTWPQQHNLPTTLPTLKSLHKYLSCKPYKCSTRPDSTLAEDSIEDSMPSLSRKRQQHHPSRLPSNTMDMQPQTTIVIRLLEPDEWLLPLSLLLPPHSRIIIKLLSSRKSRIPEHYNPVQNWRSILICVTNWKWPVILLLVK
mmetsp:Transcript_33938/g.82334  ORF Transcript_33938/g.82334 Transcript_33938/m.82334 type:complete len:237 (+) Transcript_33938:1191-1901(+)